MADRIDDASDYMSKEDAERLKPHLQVVAVAWMGVSDEDAAKARKAKKKAKLSVLAEVVPFPTTVYKAKHEFLGDTKGVDIGDSPWATAYRKDGALDGEILTSGYPELRDAAREAFIKNEGLVSV